MKKRHKKKSFMADYRIINGNLMRIMILSALKEFCDENNISYHYEMED